MSYSRTRKECEVESKLGPIATSQKHEKECEEEEFLNHQQMFESKKKKVKRKKLKPIVIITQTLKEEEA
jgi:hypothetical protein